jgi:hypothetical protein
MRPRLVGVHLDADAVGIAQVDRLTKWSDIPTLAADVGDA